MLSKILKELEDRKVEIRTKLESNQAVDLEALKVELEQIATKETEVRAKMELAQNVIAKPVEKPSNTLVYDEQKEYRSAFYKTMMGKNLTPIETRAMSTSTSSAGYAIPETLSNAIYRTLEAKSSLYALVKKTFIKGTFSMLVADPSADAAAHTENAAVTSDDTINPVKLTWNGYEIMKVINVSKAALTMTIDAFETYIAEEIATKMILKIEKDILSGNGTSESKGILTETLTEVNFTTDPTYASILEALGTLNGVFANGASFIMNRKTFFTKIMGIVDTNGRPIVVADVQAPAKFNILGYPVVICDSMADDKIVLGNLNYYQINFQEGINVERNDSVGFTSGYVCFRGYALLDGKCIDKKAFILIEKA